ncbi:hypothetical protein [Tsukamurella hominis]|uniref:hypothetical protein n=1 Tax=Tsukamurella hominis TaxID=1970232 RepID=UPI0039EA3111
MPVVTRALRARPLSRFLLGALLAVAAAVHLIRIGMLPCPEGSASCAGLGIAYAVLLGMVVLGERWGYLAAAIFPLIAQLLGDYRSFAYYGNPIDAMDPVVDLLVVPIALCVIRSTGKADRARSAPQE